MEDKNKKIKLIDPVEAYDLWTEILIKLLNKETLSKEDTLSLGHIQATFKAMVEKTVPRPLHQAETCYSYNGIRGTEYHCPMCGTQIKKGWTFCPMCAQALDTWVDPNDKEEDK